jgi:hypothetical protein
MGAYCRIPLPRHIAADGETLEVLWSDYYGAALFGERREIACVPHTGCRLEIVATAPTESREVTRLLPGQVLPYRRTFFLLDQLVLPSGRRATLGHFVGFKLRLMPAVTPQPPREEIVVQRARETQRALAAETYRTGH